VNFLYPDESLEQEADVLIEKLANGPTQSYAGSKQALNRMIYPDIDGQLDLEAELQHSLARTSDFREGVTAFVTKRDPQFTGG
jgi:2-(1,2-epoxy-1,2-dihydrophenyl)acetyl-CoA isomerase